MPLFDFKCPDCDFLRENKLIKMGNTDVVPCPECGTDMNKLYGIPLFKMGKSCSVKINPSKNEQIRSEALMEDYKARARGDIS